MKTELATRRTLARHTATPPAIRPQVAPSTPPSVAVKFVAPVAPERPPAISTEVWGYVAVFLTGAAIGAWLMGMAA